MLYKSSRDKISRFVRQFKNLVYPDAIILMYHRIAEIDSDPWSLSVTPQHFTEHLEVLRKLGRPVHLDRLGKNLDDRKIENRNLVITFDDGYADNLYNAKPILEKYDVPATVFVVTDSIDQQNEFWWDKLERLFLKTNHLPSLLQFNVRSRSYQWDLAEAVSYSETEYLKYLHWKIDTEPEVNPTRRHNVFRGIYRLLQPLPVHERWQLLKYIGEWANSHNSYGMVHRSLNSKELVALDKGDLIEIGAHTKTHPLLPELTIVGQMDEIVSSKNYSEKVLGHPITSFAYPYGRYANDTISLVKEAGFECACSCIHGRVRHNSDLFLLPRIAVEDCDGETFERWLVKTAF